MKALIVYDSVHGNTEQIAKAIGSAAGEGATVMRIGAAIPESLDDFRLLIIGSPTHGGRPTPAIQAYVKSIPDSAIKGMRVAAFDTRFSSRMVRVFGYAADRLAREMESRGGILAAPPEGFIVKGREGPLREGELERASLWARKLAH